MTTFLFISLTVPQIHQTLKSNFLSMTLNVPKFVRLLHTESKFSNEKISYQIRLINYVTHFFNHIHTGLITNKM